MRRFASTIVIAASITALASCTGSESPEPGGSVVAVRITPNNPVVLDNATLAFAAVVVLETGEERDVSDSPSTTWLSSDTGVVSVNADGIAEAQGVGEAYITARYSGITSPAQLVTVNVAPTPTPTPPPANHLVISELMYNPNTEPAGQYVEIHNPTASNVDMQNWTVNYNNGGGTAFTFGVFTLNAGAYVVLANDPTLFDNVTYPSVTNIFQYVMPNLSNTGDWFILRNPTPATIDEVAYGAGFAAAKPAGWCATDSPSSANAFPASRKPVNLDGDTCGDFVGSASPNPGIATP